MVCICQPLQCNNTTMTTLTNPKMTWVAQGLVLIGIPTRVSNSTLSNTPLLSNKQGFRSNSSANSNQLTAGKQSFATPTG